MGFTSWKGGDVAMERQGPVDVASSLILDLLATPMSANVDLPFDLVVAGYRYLKVVAQIGNATTPATAATDANAYVLPYNPDGSIYGLSLATVRAGNSLSAPLARRVSEFDVSGIAKVQLHFANKNAAALQGARFAYFLST